MKATVVLFTATLFAICIAFPIHEETMRCQQFCTTVTHRCSHCAVSAYVHVCHTPEIGTCIIAHLPRCLPSTMLNATAKNVSLCEKEYKVLISATSCKPGVCYYSDVPDCECNSYPCNCKANTTSTPPPTNTPPPTTTPPPTNTPPPTTTTSPPTTTPPPTNTPLPTTTPPTTTPPPSTTTPPPTNTPPLPPLHLPPPLQLLQLPPPLHLPQLPHLPPLHLPPPLQLPPPLHLPQLPHLLPPLQLLQLPPLLHLPQLLHQSPFNLLHQLEEIVKQE